jgi:hypothetical protein
MTWTRLALLRTVQVMTRFSQDPGRFVKNFLALGIHQETFNML